MHVLKIESDKIKEIKREERNERKVLREKFAMIVFVNILFMIFF